MSQGTPLHLRSKQSSDVQITRRRSLSAPCRQTPPIVIEFSRHVKSQSMGYIISPHAQIRMIKKWSEPPTEVCVFRCSSCNQVRGNRFRVNLPELNLNSGQSICQLCALSQELVILANRTQRMVGGMGSYHPSSRSKLQLTAKPKLEPYLSIPDYCRGPRMPSRHLHTFSPFN